MGFADGTAAAVVDRRYGVEGLKGDALQARYRELGREISAAQGKRVQVSLDHSANVRPGAGSVKQLPATEKQIAFLMDVRAAKTPHVDPEQALAWAQSAGRYAVSLRIDELKQLPNATTGTGAPTSNVPAGRYAVDGSEGQTVFVKVDRPTEGPFRGRAFVRVQAGDDLHRVSPAVRDALLAKIEAAGVETSSRRYGREIGACGLCNRTLTDPESRAAGIGPVCAAKAGW